MCGEARSGLKSTLPVLLAPGDRQPFIPVVLVLSVPSLYYSSLIASRSLGFKTGTSPMWVAVLPGSFPSGLPLLQKNRRGSYSTEWNNTLYGTLGRKTECAIALIRGPWERSAWKSFNMAHHLAQGPLGTDKPSARGEGTWQAFWASHMSRIGLRYLVLGMTLINSERWSLCLSFDKLWVGKWHSQDSHLCWTPKVLTLSPITWSFLPLEWPCDSHWFFFSSDSDEPVGEQLETISIYYQKINSLVARCTHARICMYFAYCRGLWKCHGLSLSSSTIYHPNSPLKFGQSNFLEVRKHFYQFHPVHPKDSPHQYLTHARCLLYVA